MEKALHDTPPLHEFFNLGAGVSRLPDETTILSLGRLLERHDLVPDMPRLVSAISVRRACCCGWARWWTPR
jgi:IS5 family transposase